MNEFYTVSRGDISNLKHLTLFEHDDSKPIYEVTNLFSMDDARTVLKMLYPLGISNHGAQYLYDRLYYVKDSYGRDYVSNTPLIESTFELVRLWKHPNKPSRFSSFFGCLTIEDAITFKQKFCQGKGDIYKVSSKEYFKADMTLLYTAASIPGNYYLADKYWNGGASLNPFWEVLMSNPVNIISKIT